MAILTHGSDTRLAPTLAPLVPAAAGTVQGALRLVAEAGLGAVQLDATLRGIRPRELDQRARRDLVATVARAGLSLAGLDFFVPRRHFTDAAHVDRAMTAAIGAIQLAADLGRLPVSLGLPVRDLAEDARAALVEAADGHGVVLAVHAEDQLDALLPWVDAVDLPVLGVGFDPAVALARKADPQALAASLGKRLRVARLADWSSEADDATDGAAVGARCVVGQGELDVMPYRMTVDLASGRTGPIVLDLRQMRSPVRAMHEAVKQWNQAAFEV